MKKTIKPMALETYKKILETYKKFPVELIGGGILVSVFIAGYITKIRIDAVCPDNVHFTMLPSVCSDGVSFGMSLIVLTTISFVGIFIAIFFIQFASIWLHHAQKERSGR